LLAEIFMLRLETQMKAQAPSTPASSDMRFVPITLPRRA
jgi:hypothetical protein